MEQVLEAVLPIVLVVIGFPFCVVVGLASMSTRIRKAGEKLDHLEHRLRVLETGLKRPAAEAEQQPVADLSQIGQAALPETAALSGAETPPPAPTTPEAVWFTPPEPQGETAIVPPPRTHLREAGSRSVFAELPKPAELESLIGGRWLNTIGIIVLVIGVAWFLGYSLQYPGPFGRVATGALVGVALLAANAGHDPKAATAVELRILATLPERRRRPQAAASMTKEVTGSLADALDEYFASHPPPPIASGNSRTCTPATPKPGAAAVSMWGAPTTGIASTERTTRGLASGSPMASRRAFSR
jgi:hypothetical protein